MPEGLQNFLIVACFAFIVSAVSSAWRRWRRGRELSAYAMLCRRLGWQHAPRAVVGAVDRFLGDTPFPEGRSAAVTVTDHCLGTYRGHGVSTFEATFITRGMPDGDCDDPGDSEIQRSTFAVWSVQLPHRAGEFTVRRTGAVRRALGVGTDDVRIGHDAFDERFTVRTLQESAATATLRGALADFLLTDPRAKDYPLRFTGDEVFSWDEHAQSPERIEPALDFLTEVAELVAQAPVPEPENGERRGLATVRTAVAAAPVAASPTEHLITLVETELALTGAPFRIATTASRFDIVPDLADPRWQGRTSVRLWQVTPDPEKRTYVLAVVQHRLNEDGSLGGVTLRTVAGDRTVRRATQDAAVATDVTGKHFGVAVVGRVASGTGWRATGDWVAALAFTAAAMGGLAAVAAGITLLAR
ncbi:hypothetical protein ACFV9W_31800 [Streptomyces sp. NPDC059897]|uniref:hypothetical protein n=1 Tax=Streptomyces sp. NPDC059897 TaxID=3346994 RepID=UPI00365C6B70